MSYEHVESVRTNTRVYVVDLEYANLTLYELAPLQFMKVQYQEVHYGTLRELHRLLKSLLVCWVDIRSHYRCHVPNLA